MKLIGKIAFVGVLALVYNMNFAQAQEKSSSEKPAKQKTAKLAKVKPAPPKKSEAPEKVVKTEAEWKKILTPLQFDVTRKAGTERAYTGNYWNNHDAGSYRCSDCDLELFSSKTKFDSGTGWPSFFQAISDKKIIVKRDPDGDRMEVLCARCDAHLGHVFDDGPKPTGLRYCMNSVSLKFHKDELKTEKKK